MSLNAFVAVSRCPHVKGAARRVAFQLADAHNELKGNAFPGQRLMAAREGVSTKTIENGVRQLEEAGFVTVKRRPGRGNVYYLDLERMRALGVDSLPDASNSALVPKPSSAPNNSDQSTDAPFGSAPKPSSSKSVPNRSNERTVPKVDRPREYHNQRTRQDWARELAYYRRKLGEGLTRPFWHPNWGPKPDKPDCRAPQDLLKRFGFLIDASSTEPKSSPQ